MKERGLNFFYQWKIYFTCLRIDLGNAFLAHDSLSIYVS